MHTPPRSYFFSCSLLFSCMLVLLSSCSDKKETQLPSTAIPEQFSFPIAEVDFDVSMGKGSHEFDVIFTNENDVARYQLFKSLYTDNLPSKVISSQTPKIPKIIHQIWLGPKTPPAYFTTFRD